MEVDISESCNNFLASKPRYIHSIVTAVLEETGNKEPYKVTCFCIFKGIGADHHISEIYVGVYPEPYTHIKETSVIVV